MKTFKQFILEGNPLSRIHKHSETGRHFVVLSAHRPSDEASAVENKKRHAELKKKLSAQGYSHREVEGHWEGGKEKSILVHAKKPGTESGEELKNDMKKHAEHYNQDAIMHHDGQKASLHGTNATGYPGKGKVTDIGKIKHNRPEAPFQTETKPKSDNPLKKGRTDKSSAKFTTESEMTDYESTLNEFLDARCITIPKPKTFLGAWAWYTEAKKEFDSTYFSN